MEAHDFSRVGLHRVHASLRVYAYTEAECIELYNDAVKRRISELQKLVELSESDYIKIGD